MDQNQQKAIGAALRASWERGAAEEALEHIDAAIGILGEGGKALAYDALKLSDVSWKLRERYLLPRKEPKGFVIELCSDDGLEAPKAQCDCIRDYAAKAGKSIDTAQHIIKRAAMRNRLGKETKTNFRGEVCKIRIVSV